MQQSRNRIRRGLALILALLALVGSLTACGAQQGWRGKEIVVIDDNYRTWYEIFVYSFCDSDGDRVGDLQGVVRVAAHPQGQVIYFFLIGANQLLKGGVIPPPGGQHQLLFSHAGPS